ncbi:MAG TPA: hypothetical protein VGE73_06050 [Pseudolabrys sp.]|jgi:hypothetical protein
MIDRQKLIGWIILLWSGGYIFYLLKVRLLVVGPPIERREWIYLIMSLVGLVLGTLNVRMAAARLRGDKVVWSKSALDKPAEKSNTPAKKAGKKSDRKSDQAK